MFFALYEGMLSPFGGKLVANKTPPLFGKMLSVVIKLSIETRFEKILLEEYFTTSDNFIYLFTLSNPATVFQSGLVKYYSL